MLNHDAFNLAAGHLVSGYDSDTADVLRNEIMLAQQQGDTRAEEAARRDIAKTPNGGETMPWQDYKREAASRPPWEDYKAAAPKAEAPKKDDTNKSNEPGGISDFLGSLEKGASDLGGRISDQAKEIYKNATDPEFLKKTLQATKESVGETGKTISNFFQPGVLPTTGAAELGANIGSATPAWTAAPFVGAINAAKNGTSFEDEFAGAGNRLMYHPDTPQGQEGADLVGKAFNAVGLPVMPLHGSLGMPPLTDRQAMDAMQNSMYAKRGGLDARVEPTMGHPAMDYQHQAEMFPETMQDQTGHASPYNAGVPPEQSPYDAQAARGAQVDQALLPFKKMDVDLNEGGDMAGKPVIVDKNGVANDRPLDTNARLARDGDETQARIQIEEQARNEMAQRFAKTHDEYIKKNLEAIDKNVTDRDDARVAEMQRLSTQEVVDRLKNINDALDGLDEFNNRYGSMDRSDVLDQGNPINVDPQSQAFRGDVNDPNARLALDRQGAAMDTELTHLRGQGTPSGEPLRPLQDHVLNEDRAGAKQALTDIKALEPAAPKKGGKGKGQSGGVTLDLLTLGLLPKNNPVRKMGKSKDGTYIPENITPEALEKALTKARSEPDGRSFKNFESGADSASMKRGSTAIGLVGSLVQNAFKRADLSVRNIVIPVERAIGALSTRRMEMLAEGVFKKEIFTGQVDKAELARMPADVAQAYRVMRESLDKTLDVQNSIRALQGREPITRVEAYMAASWDGPFRRPLFDKAGKVKWYLADHSKRGLDAQTRSVLKDFPELTYDPLKDHTVTSAAVKTDIEAAYTVALDVLGRDDPAVAAIRQYMEEKTKRLGQSYMDQEQHFKNKAGVRGFMGDRPAKSIGDYTDKNLGPLSNVPIGFGQRKAESLSLLQAQIQYMKNGLRYAELQKVTPMLKQILNDPELMKNQPKNMEYARDYFKSAAGFGQHAAISAMSDAIKGFGVDFSGLSKAVGGAKSFFILQKLGASLPYIATQGLQLTMVIPHMVDLAVKGRFVSNPIKAVSAGIVGGLTMATGHVFNGVTHGRSGAKFSDVPGADFFNKASKYAEDNGITARSVYDESPLKDSFSKTGVAVKTFGKTISMPETYIRSVAFMTLAQFLKDSGKYDSEEAIFKEAERRTNFSMVDYANTEKPMIFKKLGVVGDFLNTLQTFPTNYYNQFSYFMRQAAKGNVLPFLTAMAVQYAIAGIEGIPGAEDVYKSYMALKDMAPPKMWVKLQQNEFLREPKLWLLKSNAGTSAAYGWLSDKSGINWQSRLAAPSAGQMLTSPGGPAVEMGKQALDVGKLALDPTNTTKQAQAAYSVAPTGEQGLVETSPQLEGINHTPRDNGTTLYTRPTKMEERSGLVTRTPHDETVRKFGFRTMKETVERDVNYANKRDSDKAQQIAKDVPGKFYDAIRRGDLQDATEWQKTYAFVTGKGISREAFQAQARQEFYTDAERNAKSAKSNLQAALNVKRAMDVFDQVARESNGNK